MSDSLGDLLATDAAIDLIATREPSSPDDRVLAALSALAWAVDDEPLPALATTRSPVPMTRSRKGAFALAASVALMLSTSGVAAAVCDDPLAPLRYVAAQVFDLGPHDDSPLPGWDLEGSKPLSSSPHEGVLVPGRLRLDVTQPGQAAQVVVVSTGTETHRSQHTPSAGDPRSPVSRDGGNGFGGGPRHGPRRVTGHGGRRPIGTRGPVPVRDSDPVAPVDRGLPGIGQERAPAPVVIPGTATRAVVSPNRQSSRPAGAVPVGVPTARDAATDTLTTSAQR